MTVKTTPTDEILTAKECADILKVNVKTVYNLLSEKREPNKIFARKVGREWRVKREEVMRYLSQEAAEEEQTKEHP